MMHWSVSPHRIALRKPRAKWGGWLKRVRWTREPVRRLLRPPPRSPVLGVRRPTCPVRVPLWRKVSQVEVTWAHDIPHCPVIKCSWGFFSFHASLRPLLSLPSPCSGGLVENSSDNRRFNLLQFPGGSWDGVPGLQKGEFLAPQRRPVGE